MESPRAYGDPGEIDGLATVSPPPSTKDNMATYGSSSTISFLRLLIGDAGGCRGDRSNGYTQEMSQRLNIERCDLTSSLLPNRRLADNFLESFWRFVHPLYPIVNRAKIEGSYQYLWSPLEDKRGSGVPHSETKVFWSTMNIIFALGCQFSNLVEPSQQAVLGSQFYRRSQDIYLEFILDAATIESVQLLLLASVYLQSTQHASRCWNTLGLAIRAAQAIGLHLEHHHADCENQLEREIGRRVWYNCVILDRLQSMTFGRPTMLPHSYGVKPPLQIDDEYLQGSASSPNTGMPLARISFFLRSIELFDILSEILTIFYARDEIQLKGKAQRCEGQDRLQNMLKLNAALENFWERIPSHLDPHQIASAEVNECFKLQANVLYCRFLYIRMLLLRPILLSTCDKGRDSNKDRDVTGLSSFETHFTDLAGLECVKIASTLIEVLHTNLRSMMRNSVWYTVYFTFSAATILFAAFNCPMANVSKLHAAYTGSWDKALVILQYHQGRIQSAGKAIKVLQTLRAKVFRSNSAEELATACENFDPRSDDQICSLMGAPDTYSDINHQIFDNYATAVTLEDLSFEDNLNSVANAWFTHPMNNLDIFDFEPS